MKKFLILAAALLVACGSSEDKQAKLNQLKAEYTTLGEQIRELEAEIGKTQTESTDAKSIEMSTIARKPFSRRVTVQGVVDGDEIISLNPRASGEVVMLNAVVGQTVKANDILIKIDDKILRKGLEELKTALDLANTVYERQAALWKDSIGSEIQYIQAKNTKKSLEDKIASLKEQIDLYQIKAPIDGTLEVVNTKLGEMVSPQQPVVVMINLNKLKLVTEVSEAYSSAVRKGDKLNVRFPDINKEYELTITTVSNFINPKNRTFSLEAKLPNGITDVKANMMAKVAIESYKSAEAIVVPINVIFNNNQGDYLFTVQEVDGKLVAHKKFVRTGMKSDNEIEILDGLTEGDRIVTMGYQTLEDGIEVVVKN